MKVRSRFRSGIEVGMAALTTMTNHKHEFTEHDLQGLKHVRFLRTLLVRLRGIGTEHDKAGNRELFMAQYVHAVIATKVFLSARSIGNCGSSSPPNSDAALRR